MSDTSGLHLVEFREDPLMAEPSVPWWDRVALDYAVASSGIVVCGVAGMIAAVERRPLLSSLYLGAGALWAYVLGSTRTGK